MKADILIFLLASLKIASSEVDDLDSTDKMGLEVSTFNQRKKYLSAILKDPFSSLDYDNFLSQVFSDTVEPKTAKDSQSTIYMRTSDQPNETDLLELMRVLENLLQQKGPWKAPLVIFEEPPEKIDKSVKFPEIEKSLKLPEIEKSVEKRARYYRRYPWKRRNSSSSYDYEPEYYLCSPSRREVSKLLVTLHGAQRGSRMGFDFCKRQKLINGIAPNIRFLGRKK